MSATRPKSPTRLARIVARARTLAQSPWSAPAVVLCACVLVLPCVTVGLATDDLVQIVRQTHDSGVGGFDYDPGALFEFASGEAAQRAAAIEAGTFPWWAAEGLRLSFWRPIATATHRLDHALWPGSGPPMYLHGIAWFACLLVALAMLYRRLHGVALGLLALAIYALDDAHGPAVGFVANRNAVVGAALGALALLAHDRWRRGQRPAGPWLAATAFGLALLASEASVAVAGYLFAYALMVERGGAARRVRSLAPYLAVGLVWMVAYVSGDFGARNSGVYVDPGGESAAFASALVERLPAVLLGQLGTPFSDFWLFYPPHVKPLVWCAAVLAIGVFVAVAWRQLRGSRELRFWALGALLAALPVCGTFPSDRLLMFVGIGAAPVIAAVVASPWRSESPARPGLWSGLVIAALVGVHLLLGPLLLPIRARSMDTVGRATALLDDAVARDGIAEQTVVVVMAPTDGLVCYLPFLRATSERSEQPVAVRLLATAPSGASVVRTDAHTLVVRPDDGLLSTEGERLLRSLRVPFEVGVVVELSDVAITVLELTADGRPAAVEARFATPLDDGTRTWITWYESGFVPFEVPEVGQTAVLPAVDSAETLRRLLE